jgi:hypothetical protein
MYQKRERRDLPYKDVAGRALKISVGKVNFLASDTCTIADPCNQHKHPSHSMNAHPHTHVNILYQSVKNTILKLLDQRLTNYSLQTKSCPSSDFLNKVLSIVACPELSIMGCGPQSPEHGPVLPSYTLVNNRPWIQWWPHSTVTG